MNKKTLMALLLLPGIHAGASVPALAGEQPLSLGDYLTLVQEKNEKIAYQKMEWAVASEGVNAANAIYEPVLSASYKYLDSDTPNTTEEQYRLNFSSEYLERNHDYVVGVEGMAPTGAKLKLSYTLRQLNNNIQPSPLAGKEDKSFLGGSVVQPLLKGFGSEVTEAGIRIAESDEAISGQTYRQAMFETVSGAAIAYWELYLAQEKLALRSESVKIAEKVLQDEKARARLGRVAETALLSSEAGVAQRRALLIEAEQSVVTARNDVRRYISRQPGQVDADVLALTQPQQRADVPAYDDLLANAYQLRPEYLAAKTRIEKEGVSVAFAENNTLPQLDFSASYGLNGLDKTVGDSWGDLTSTNHPTWFVGVEYKMPLTGDKKGHSELAAANLRKGQAMLELRNAELSIQNSIDTAIRNLKAAHDQVELLGMVVANNRSLLDVELAKFDSGQSNSRQVLEREEMLNRALETNLEGRINLQKALIGIKLAEGTLLREYGIEN